MQRVSSVSAPANFLVQCFRNFDSKGLSAEDLGKEFSRICCFALLLYWFMPICLNNNLFDIVL